jgi:hypothetical protein
VNTSGMDKKLFVIGGFQKPQCFRCVKKLPLEWLTSDVFKKCASKWNKLKNNYKETFLVDNCPAHPVM